MGLTPVSRRIVFLDWLRGLAAIVMLQGHTFDSFLRPELREHPAFIFSQFFGGQAAAIFLFLTGITFGLGMNKREDLPAWQRITGALRRARYLFLLAIAFRLQMWIFALPNQPWTDLLRVDVLNLMGATAALLSMIALARGMQRVRWAVLAGIALAALAPVMSGLETGGLPQPGARLLRAQRVGVQHVPVGIVSGVRIGGGERGAVREARNGAASCSGPRWAGSDCCWPDNIFRTCRFPCIPTANFWLNSPALVACKLGITLLLGRARSCGPNISARDGAGYGCWGPRRWRCIGSTWSWCTDGGWGALSRTWRSGNAWRRRRSLVLAMVGMSAAIWHFRRKSVPGASGAKRAAA